MIGIAKIHDVDVLRRLSHFDTTGSSTGFAARVELTRATDVTSAQLEVRSLIRQFPGRSPDLRGQVLTESRNVVPIVVVAESAIGMVELSYTNASRPLTVGEWSLRIGGTGGRVNCPFRFEWRLAARSLLRFLDPITLCVSANAAIFADKWCR